MNTILDNINITSDLKILTHSNAKIKLINDVKWYNFCQKNIWIDAISDNLSITKSQSKNIISILNNSYNNNVNYLLTQLTNFNTWPGYPYILSGKLSEHINYVCNYLSCKDKLNPKVPIFAFPKSASSYITVVLSELFKSTPTVLSFDHIFPVKPWINAFSKWGGIIHDHYYPSERNIATLIDSGINKFIVHTRDPINTFISFSYHMVDGYCGYGNATLSDKEKRKTLAINYFNENLNELICYYNSWNEGWAHAENTKKIKILYSSYEEMISDPKKYFHSILNFMDTNFTTNDIDQIINNLKPDHNKINKFNFRNGSGNEIHDFINAADAKKVHSLTKWSAI